MVGSVNKAILVGNVGKDPEIKNTQDGRKIALLVLATSESWKNKMTGERQEKTEWHRIVIYNDNLVNVVENYVRKGSKLFIEGTLQTRKWTDQSGQERYTTEIVLQGYNATLTMLDSRNSQNNEGEFGQNQNFGSNKGSSKELVMEDIGLDDDLPF